MAFTSPCRAAPGVPWPGSAVAGAATASPAPRPRDQAGRATAGEAAAALVVAAAGMAATLGLLDPQPPSPSSRTEQQAASINIRPSRAEYALMAMKYPFLSADARAVTVPPHPRLAGVTSGSAL